MGAPQKWHWHKILRQSLADELVDPLALTDGDSCVRLGLRNAEERGHFVVLEAFSGNVWLYPGAIDDELRDGSLSRALDDFLRGAGNFFNIDLMVGNVVLGEPALCDMAIAAPRGGVDS